MSASDLLRQQNEEYEESLRQDILREQEEIRLQEEEQLQQAIKASLSEQTELECQTEIESETEKPLSPRALREVRMRYFEQKQSKLSNRVIKRKNGINESLMIKSKLRSGKT